MEPKTVCYFASFNIYNNVQPSLKSLLKNGNIDQVYVFIESDSIGYDVPSNVHVVDVSHQNIFRPDGPNYNCNWTYMVLMKTAVCHLLPGLHRALTLDVDTIVTRDISPLWNTDMTGYCVAGCREPYWYDRLKREYVNGGVLYWNLDEMREYGAVGLIKAINERKYSLCEQDAISERLEGKILKIDGSYNSCPFTEKPTEHERILHYAAWGQRRFMLNPDVKRYMQMGWPNE